MDKISLGAVRLAQSAMLGIRRQKAQLLAALAGANPPSSI